MSKKNVNKFGRENSALGSDDKSTNYVLDNGIFEQV